ncbi:MAG: hypothetical protein CfP315_0868 [Candidatus Improbicoccus pseudotrichonymphae]|uniref:Rab-GAP TBC domain-containing protein n=1 Tax=Candidatus Improbicoccus pseudotrichonymphae TaxID=3033792 RepID=A0AA48I3H8_9FIRM|nr:MAG: hypothetical protein CfP315_0868 [Candidatus Improbicoccus pseudotrichonymphae]
MKKENSIDDNKNSKKISKNNKIISSILAVIMCCQSLVGAVPLNTDGKVNVAGPPVSGNIDSENDLKDSEGKDEGDNKNPSKEEEEEKDNGNVIKNNPIKSTIAGVVIGCLGIYYIATELCSRNFHKKIISKYLDASSEYHSVSADTWFQRLGGKKEDIDKYYERREELEEKISCMSDKERRAKGINVIENDYPRSGDTSFKDEDKSKNLKHKKILERILKIGVLDGIDYIQGYDRYAILAIFKFFIYNLNNHGSESEEKKEAEAYYVYKIIVYTTKYNFKDVINSGGKAATTLFLEILNKYFIKCPGACELVEGADGIIACPLLSYFLLSGMDLFTIKQSIKIWDSIILNNDIVKKGNFSPERAQEQIFTIIIAVLLEVYSNFDSTTLITEYLQTNMPKYCESLKDPFD